MIKSTFVLKDVNAIGETPILLYLRYNYDRLRYYTGEKIKPALWLKYYNSAENTKKLITVDINNKNIKEQFDSINTQLGRYGDKIKTLNNYFKTQKIEPSLNYVKGELDKEFIKNQKPQTTQLDLFSFIEDFNKTTNRREGTLKGYRNTLQHLKDFQQQQKKKLKFENIDLDFYDDFVKYLKNKGFADNTIGKQIKNIKVFLSNAEARELHSNHFYKNKRFKVISEDTDSIYLSVDELEKIYNHDFSDDKKLDRVRDLFIIACWTGLRFSDMCELSINNISKTNYGKLITIKTVKTGETVVIPVHNTIIEILKKYKNILPRVPVKSKDE